MRSILYCLLLVALTPMVGCMPDAMFVDVPDDDPRMAPFQGKWRMDFEGTISAMEEEGTDAKTVQAIREFHEQHADLSSYQDVTITGLAITGQGVISDEYRLFSLHKHGDTLCAKAWYHEDRHDPGDMNKCFIQLVIVDSKLKMTVNHLDGWPDLNDPDLAYPIDGDAEACTTPDSIKSAPEEWMITVFVR